MVNDEQLFVTHTSSPAVLPEDLAFSSSWRGLSAGRRIYYTKIIIKSEDVCPMEKVEKEVTMLWPAVHVYKEDFELFSRSNEDTHGLIN